MFYDWLSIAITCKTNSCPPLECLSASSFRKYSSYVYCRRFTVTVHVRPNRSRHRRKRYPGGESPKQTHSVVARSAVVQWCGAKRRCCRCVDWQSSVFKTAPAYCLWRYTRLCTTIIRIPRQKRKNPRRVSRPLQQQQHSYWLCRADEIDREGERDEKSGTERESTRRSKLRMRNTLARLKCTWVEFESSPEPAARATFKTRQSADHPAPAPPCHHPPCPRGLPIARPLGGRVSSGGPCAHGGTPHPTPPPPHHQPSVCAGHCMRRYYASWVD